MAAAALLSLLAVTVAFIAGMALLSAVSRPLATTQDTAPERVMGSLQKVAAMLTGEGRTFLRNQVATAFVVYALIGILVLLPLGRRFPRGLLLLLLSSPPLVAILVVSSGIYSFNLMLWPPRLATLFALVVACLAFASFADSTAHAEVGLTPSTLGVGLGVLFSWGLQIVFLARLGYSPWPRVDAMRLLSGRHYNIATVPKEELRFLRCVAGRLPGGLPISTVGNTHPVFHRQSIVFRKYPAQAWHPPRLRVIHASDAAPAREGPICLGPRAGTLVVEAECALIPLVASCGGAPEPEGSY